MSKMAIPILLVFLVGCTSLDAPLDERVRKHNEGLKALVKNNAIIDTVVANNAKSGAVVNDKWVGQKRIKIRDYRKLPAQFREPRSIFISRKMNLYEVAREITRNTGIPVRVSSDAVATLNAPVEKSGSAENGTRTDLDYNQKPLVNILDGISSSFNTSYEYHEDEGAIYFSRFITRTFKMDIVQGQSTSNVAVGKSGESGSTSASSSTSSTTVNYWDKVEDLLKPVLSSDGKINVNASLRMIVITDTIQNIRRAEKIIEDINTDSTKQIALKVDVISVNETDSGQVGVNWKAVLKNVSGGATLSFNSVSSTIASSAANIGFSVLTPTGGDGTPFDGSTLIFKALKTISDASVVSSSTQMTLNNRMTPIAITDSENFIKSTTAASSASSAATTAAVGINTEKLTTGFILGLQPSLLRDGDIAVKFYLDNSVLRKMDEIVSSGQKVSNPKISSTQTEQTFKMRLGSTMIVSGLTRLVANKARTGLPYKGDAVGGDVSNEMSREDLVIMITPVAVY